MQGLENNNWIILALLWNNSGTFRELIQNNTTHFLSEFISNNTESFREILPHKALFGRVHIKQYWHVRRVTTKQYHTYFSEFISHKTFSGSYYEIILYIFSEFISKNIDNSRATTKQYCKIILFYQTKLTLP